MDNPYNHRTMQVLIVPLYFQNIYKTKGQAVCVKSEELYDNILDTISTHVVKHIFVYDI